MLTAKYRPTKFEEVLGNWGVVESLKGIVAKDKKTRPHSFLFVGQPGTGKCLIGDTLILTERGLKPISYFSVNLMGSTPKNVKLLSKDGEVVSDYFYEEVVNKTIKITNNLGLCLEGTTEHPILVLEKNCTFSFKKLKDIEIGEFVCIPQANNYFPTTNCKINYDNTFSPHDHSSIPPIDIPIEIDNQLARLIGYLVANGSADKNNIQFSSTNKRIIDDITFILQRFGQKVYKKDDKNKDYTLGGRHFNKFILNLFGVDVFPTARKKTIPTIILESSEEVQLEFLKSYLDCDSSLYKKYLAFECCSASEQLINQLQILLLNIGIISKKVPKKVKNYDWTYYNLFIYGKYVNLLLRKVSGSLKYSPMEESTKSPNNHIPFLKEVLIHLRKKLGVKTSGVYLYEGKYFRFLAGRIGIKRQSDITYFNLDKLIFNLDVMYSNTPIEDIGELLSICKNIKKYGFYFSKIISKEVFFDNKIVYDFTINSKHNFFSNGYISHNTTLARILAREVGAVAVGVDLIEVNAANFRGIEDMRSIADVANSYPFADKARVIILDESHQLTTPAQQMLLKAVEEPLETTYFIFCTTDIQKFIPTLVDRCVQFQVKPITITAIEEYIRKICSLEEWSVSDEIIQLIAEHSEGRPRDALISLETVSTITDVEKAKEFIIENTSQDQNVLDLFKIIMLKQEIDNANMNVKWRKIVGVYNRMSSEPEQTRRAILTMLKKRLLSVVDDRQAYRIASLMKIFDKTTYDSGDATLVRMLYLTTLVDD